MHRQRKKRKIVLIALLIILVFMGIGYSAFSSNLKITGNTKITSNWDVEITDISAPTINGSAEEVNVPTYDKLSANINVNLYEPGDSVEYDVTISNLGSIDATLDNYILGTSTSSMKVTFSNFTKGEILYKKGHSNSTKDIHVKVEYNPEYSGGEVSEETSINFLFKQPEVKELTNDEVISKDKYLVTYDCTTNGGSACTDNNEYLLANSSVDLTKTGTKEGYTFVGWNTDKDATSALSTYTMPNENKTLYGIYQKTINITYEIEGQGITNISKNSDTCTIYNKTSSCDKTLPTVTLDNDAENTYYELDGWYIGDTKIENPGSNHTYTDSVTVKAKAIALPVMMSGPDFQTKIDSVKQAVTEIEFVDTDEVIPPTTIDNATSWDVSAKQNSSVIAWMDGTKMYIGGKDGAVGNTNCDFLFNEFNNAIKIDFNDLFDTFNTTSMKKMFSMFDYNYGIELTSKLQTIVFGNKFDTSNVIDFSDIFYNCRQLILLDVSGFDTSKAISMLSMFYNCQSLNYLYLNNFNTRNVTNMQSMFNGCKNLEELNLTNFDTRNVTNMNRMFQNCQNLETIYASQDFVTKINVFSPYMFQSSINLVGGNGTLFDSNYIDKTYARIDAPGTPGYFTDGSIPVIRNASNVSTSNSITLTVDAWVPSGDEISKIEYSIDGGNTWHEQTNQSIAKNIYTFNNLTANTNYPISIRVTSEDNKIKTENYEFTTKALSAPTYTQNKNVTTITYPEFSLGNNESVSCSNGLTCEYSLDGGTTYTTVTTTTKKITFSHPGDIIARVSDGDNMASSSYTFEPTAEDLGYDDADTNLGCGTAQCAIDKIKEEFE